jgi:sulfoxide reductase heme-binding subunit YedZ
MKGPRHGFLRWIRLHGLQLLAHVGALVPLVVMAWSYAQGRYAIDPVGQLTPRTGRTALVLLFLSLACTPVYILLGLRSILRLRRPLGLYAFVYASLHLATFVGLDYGFDLALLGPALFGQRNIVVGLAAFAVLLVLAVTSTKGWQRRLGQGWPWLHRLAYVAGVLVVVHFAWAVKVPSVPLRYGIVLALLFVVRLPAVRRAVRSVRRRIVER